MAIKQETKILDETFITEVPELAGYAADSPTPHEALAKVYAAAGEGIEAARGAPAPTLHLGQRLLRHLTKSRA
jgi:predicted RNase H-like HicB family nuclease